MNRIDRLTAILVQLQGKKVVTAAEVAERFGISLRTVYRDVKALQEAGVPIGAEAGTGYYIVEGYHLPPVMFDREEAAALLTGEKLMEQFSDPSSKKQFSNAMQKIRAVLRGSEKDFLEVLEENIAVLKRSGTPMAEEFPNRFLSDIQQALGKRQVMQMEYFTFENQTLTKREVEPIGIYYSNTSWYLIAWCRLRKDYRNFRLDRIKRLSVTSEGYDKSKHITLQEYLQQYTNDTRQAHVIKVRINNGTARYMGERKYFFGLVEEKAVEGAVEMTFLYNSLEYFGRWLIMWGNNVELISPDALKTTMKDLANEIREHYL
jgi:predicted DNA-binding transcriptional regulator YafY